VRFVNRVTLAVLANTDFSRSRKARSANIKDTCTKTRSPKDTKKDGQNVSQTNPHGLATRIGKANFFFAPLR
jgi:hypothetical protein